MSTHKHRVSSKDFSVVVSTGKTVRNGVCTLKYIENETPQSPTLVSFSIPKSVEKGVVKRNKLKRVGREVLRSVYKDIKPGFVCVVFCYSNNKEDITIDMVRELFEKAELLN